MDSATKLSKNTKKKRKLNTNSTNKEVKKKKVSKSVFSEINFKLMIKNEATAPKALEQFAVEARLFPQDSDYDLVLQYCKASSECGEMFQLLEGGKRKPTEVCLVFEALELILMRTADDLARFQLVAQSVVRRLLSAHIGLLYKSLAVTNKAAHIKATLKLLTAMVMQGENAARIVSTQFRLDHPCVKVLLSRRDKKDPQDVRTCVIHFLLSFLVAGDNATVRQIVEHKDLLSALLPGIEFDSISTVQLILSTLLDKVVENPGLNKSLRIGVFGERSLGELAKLYQWKGPSNWHNKWKAKGKFTKQDQGAEPPVVETDPVDLASVRESIHHFLLELTTSLAHGITFLDKSYGTAQKNQNHLVTHLLTCLPAPHLDDLETQLVVRATAVCPDLLHWYLPSLRHALEPRSSASWGKCVAMVRQIYEAQPSILPVFTSKESLSPTKYVSIAMTQLVPPKDVWKTILATLQTEPGMRVEGLRLLLLVLTRIQDNLTHCWQKTGQSEALTEFVDLFRDSLKKIVPDSNAWMDLWRKGVQEVTVCGSEEAEQAADLPVRVTCASSLLSVICAYQCVIPPPLQSHALAYGALLEGVQEVTSRGTAPAIWPHLFQLLCGSGERSVQWTKPTKTGKSFLYLLLETVATVTGEDTLKQQIVQWVIQLLGTGGLFVGLEMELSQWLTQLRLVEESHTKAVLQFMEQTLSKLLRDPYTHTERVLEFMSESLSCSPGGATGATPSIASTSEALVDMILSLDEEICLDKGVDAGLAAGDTPSLLAFSPLVPVTLEHLSSLPDAPPGVRVYVCGVLHRVLRMQTDPLPLCLSVQKHVETLTGHPLLSHVQYFLPAGQNPISSPPTKRKKKNQPSDTCMNGSVADLLEEMFEKSHRESCSEIHDTLRETLLTMLSRLPVSEYPPISRQCTQYWSHGHTTQIETGVYEDALISLVQKLCTYTTDQCPANTPTPHDLVPTILGDILSQQSLRLLVNKLVTMTTTSPSKSSPRKRGSDQSTSDTKPWDISAVKFLRRLFQEIPDDMLPCLEKSVKLYTVELGEILDKCEPKHLSRSSLLIELFGCFWPFMADLHIARIIEAMVCDIRSLHENHGTDVAPQLEMLCKLLHRMDARRMELSGVRLSEATIVDLTYLAVTKETSDLRAAVLKMFTRFPPYCDYVGTRDFTTGLELGLFGVRVSEGHHEVKQLKRVLSKLMKTGTRQEGLLDIVTVWLIHGRHCAEMFESWVKEVESGLSVKGLNLCPLAEVYLRMNRQPDTEVVSILLSQQTRYLEWAVTGADKTEDHCISETEVPRIEGALDALLQHTDYVKSPDGVELEGPVAKLWAVFQPSKIGHITHPTQVHCYKKLVNCKAAHYKEPLTLTTQHKETLTLTTATRQLIVSFNHQLSNKQTGQEPILTAHMEAMECWLALLKARGKEQVQNKDIVGKDMQQLRTFVRLGLKHCFGEKFFRVLTELLDVLLGGRKCDTSHEKGEGELNIENKSGGRKESDKQDKMESESGDSEMESEDDEMESQSGADESDNYNEMESESEDGEMESESEDGEMESESEDDEIESESEGSGDSENLGDDLGENEMSDDKETIQGRDGNTKPDIKTAGPQEVAPLSPEYLEFVKDVFSMLLSHSAFLSTMLTEDGVEADRAGLLDLLLCLIHACPSLSDSRHLAVWLGAYGATLTPNDQKLLHLIQLYECHGCEVTQYRPYLHGSKAVEHYSVMCDMGPSLGKEVKTGQVLDCLDAGMVWGSVLNMPLTRQPGDLCGVSAPDSLHSTPDFYDPCFLLPSFCHLLAPENVVDCHAFVEHHCLSYAIAALSCHSDSLRALAYNILSRFYQQLQLSRLQEKQQVLLCLDCVRNSLTRPNTKLACVITVFLAKAVVILLNPEHALYSLVNSFLLLKPALDVHNVPEFYKLFNSSSLEYKTERGWIVGLLHEGLRETSDYRIFEKRFTFKLLLSFYDSGLSDHFMKRQILQIVTRACSIKTVAFDLTKNHGLLSWLGSLLVNCPPDHLPPVLDAVRCLWVTMLDGRDDLDPVRKNPVLPLHFLNQLLSLLLTALPGVRCFGSRATLGCFVEVLESVVRHRETAHRYIRAQNPQHTQTGDVTVSVGHVMCLLSHWCRLNCPQEVALCSLVENACASLGNTSGSHPKLQEKEHLPVIPEQHMKSLVADTSGKQCITRLLTLIQKMSLWPDGTKDDKITENLLTLVSSLTVLLQICLQLLVAVSGECGCQGLHDFFDWLRTLMREHKKMREELTQQKPLSVCVCELTKLVQYKMREAHANTQCSVPLETQVWDVLSEGEAVISPRVSGRT